MASLRELLKQNNLTPETESYQIYSRDNELLVTVVGADYGWDNIESMPIIKLQDGQSMKDGVYCIWRGDHSDKFLATSDIEIVED